MGKIKERASQDGSKCSVKGAVKGILSCSLAAYLTFQFARQSNTAGIFAAGSTTKKENVGLPSLLPFTDEAQVSPSLRGNEDSSARESPPSLFSQVAPLFFPIDAETGLIAFPVEVKTVIFDIGARESDYLQALERTKDPSVALILVDPLPSSMIPIEKRAAEYALNERGPPPRGDLAPAFTDRVFTLRAAIGDEEGVVDFNIGMGPACSSLLQKTNTTGFWCVNSSKSIRVNKFELKSVLELIPKTIESIHLKVDAEGADHLVLRGADTAIHRFKTVVIECQDMPKNHPDRYFENSCVYKEVKEYMCKDQGICNARKEGQGGLINVFFIPSNEDKVAIPNFLKTPGVAFGVWYAEVARE
jgi:FkbM family methyltransferase